MLTRLELEETTDNTRDIEDRKQLYLGQEIIMPVSDGKVAMRSFCLKLERKLARFGRLGRDILKSAGETMLEDGLESKIRISLQANNA